jgi:hypothetical protein
MGWMGFESCAVASQSSYDAAKADALAAENREQRRVAIAQL